MAVQVADTMKPKNGLDFPVVESGDVKGGLHCVASIAERDAILTSEKVQAGMLVYVAGKAATETEEAIKPVTYQLGDDLLTWSVFGGELTQDNLKTIVEYVQTNIEHSTIEEGEDGTTYLTLL